MPKICPRYAQYMPNICPRYVQDMPMMCPTWIQEMLAHLKISLYKNYDENVANESTEVFSLATVENFIGWKHLLPLVDDLKWKFLPHWAHFRHTIHSPRSEIKYMGKGIFCQKNKLLSPLFLFHLESLWTYLCGVLLIMEWFGFLMIMG